MFLFQCPESTLCATRCLWAGKFCMSCLSRPPRPTLYAMRFVCNGEVCMLHLSQYPSHTLCAVGLLQASLSSLSLPSGWGHSLGAVYGLRSATFSVFCPLIPCFTQFSKIPQLPLGPTCEGDSQCTRILPASGLLPSHPLVFHPFPFLCLHPLFYLIPGRLACLSESLRSSAIT